MTKKSRSHISLVQGIITACFLLFITFTNIKAVVIIPTYILFSLLYLFASPRFVHYSNEEEPLW